MFKRWIVGLCAVVVLAASAPVWAQPWGHVRSTVHLRAGPRIGYPVVAVVPGGVTVQIYGCLDDYSWCDVAFGADRGWVYGEYLDDYYGGRQVPVATYGPQLGIAVLAFSLIDYWSQHYPHRAWYRDRDNYRTRFGPHGEHNRPHYAPPRRERYDPGPAHRPPPRANFDRGNTHRPSRPAERPSHTRQRPSNGPRPGTARSAHGPDHRAASPHAAHGNIRGNSSGGHDRGHGGPN